MTRPRRLVVGISGATGIAYGAKVLELARKAGVETHLVVTRSAEQTRAYETELSARDLAAMADVSDRAANRLAPGCLSRPGRSGEPLPQPRTLSAIWSPANVMGPGDGH